MTTGHTFNGPDGMARKIRLLASNCETATAELSRTLLIAVSGEDRLRRDVIERLMCDMGVDLDEIALMHDVAADRFDEELSRLSALEADGIVMRDGRRLTVTEEGRPLVRAVCAVFDEYLGQGQARHSKAV